jgi:hypothetical protein
LFYKISLWKLRQKMFNFYNIFTCRDSKEKYSENKPNTQRCY